MGGKGSGKNGKDSPFVKQRKLEEEMVGEGTNRAYLMHALRIAKLPDIDRDDPQQVQDRVDLYFEMCCEDDMKPTVTGLCNALGIDRRTIRSWYNEQRRPGQPQVDIIKKAYTVLETLWEDYMSNGKINPASGIFLGRNHWGYQDQVSEVVIKPQPLGPEPSAQELAGTYLAAIPEEAFETPDPLPVEYREVSEI